MTDIERQRIPTLKAIKYWWWINVEVYGYSKCYLWWVTESKLTPVILRRKHLHFFPNAFNIIHRGRSTKAIETVHRCSQSQMINSFQSTKYLLSFIGGHSSALDSKKL